MALWAWARAVVRDGHDVLVLHAGDRASIRHGGFARAGQGGIPERAIPHAGERRAVRRPLGLRHLLGKGDVLVLHEGWVVSNLVAGREARRARVPYLVVPHGVYEESWREYLKPPRWIRARFERRLLEGAAAVHVFFRSEIPHVAKVAPRATFIVHPTGHTLPDVRWTGGGGYLSWIGRIDPHHKGLDLLVDAVATLPEARRPRLILRGYDYKGGDLRLARLVRERGLDRWIAVEKEVTGAEKTEFLRRADGYLHPSRWECHSIALLENLALGVPCLVSRSIHVAPELERARAALMTEPDVRSLATGMIELLSKGRTVAERGRAHVEAQYAWEQIVTGYLAELRQLVAG